MEKPKSRPEFKYVSPDRLRFDPTNPRFGGLEENKTPEEIQFALEQEPHFALQLVDSLLENGFIDYEPLVVRSDGNNYVVVEGNRRLAAVRHILSNRAKYESESTRIADLREIPVLIFPEIANAQGEKEQRVYLGVRHLFGFREWPAESKARFLDGNITNRGELERTMRELNITRQEIRRYPIPYRLRKKAKRLWAPYRNQDFWVLGEGLARAGIKEYIELAIDSDTLEIESFSHGKLESLLEFIYGVPQQTKTRRIRETRDLSSLAKILRSKRAAAQLEKGRSLEEAELFIETPEESLKRLKRSVSDLKILLRHVLARQQGNLAVKQMLKQFDDFETSVKAFIRNAQYPRV